MGLSWFPLRNLQNKSFRNSHLYLTVSFSFQTIKNLFYHLFKPIYFPIHDFLVPSFARFVCSWNPVKGKYEGYQGFFFFERCRKFTKRKENQNSNV
jgi:hypothetical protein